MSNQVKRILLISYLLLIVLLISGCNLPIPTSSPQSVTNATQTEETPPSISVVIPDTDGISPAAYPGILPPSDLPEIVFEVELFYTERWMRVHQTVDIENSSSDTWTEIVFNIPVNYTPGSFLLDSVKVELSGTSQEGTPPLFGQETILSVPLPSALQPGDSAHIEIGFRVIFQPVASTDWPPNGTTGWTENLIQAGEWYPALVPYMEGKGWHTWRYHPVGDPTFYPLTNVSLMVTTEPDVIVASGGSLGHEDGVWRFRVDAARGIAFLASPHYEVVEREFDDIRLSSYYLPDHAIAGEVALDVAENAIKLFSDLYGPYPYQSLTIAENGFFGGMEYSEMISITDYCYRTYRGEPNSVLIALVAHETAHQWWYGAVGNDQVYEPWLDESLAFYSELLYFEHYHPEYTKWWWKKRVDVYDPYGPVDATIYSYERSDYFIPSMYGQAARFIRDLRKIMGDEDFFAFLQDYQATYRWSSVTGQDFFDSVRSHYSGDLGPLIKAYFSRTDW
ncbi:MAG: M1 family metallopeptidase [Anaerolineae bacterium]|nr:M1 family metallopeptidase [Anaerolineae bacterium]